MATLWNKGANDYESSAKVVDGNLILSLPDAINPIVWRMDLSSVKASAMEVRKTADEKFLLSLKTPKGEVHDIAPYEIREAAVTALMRVSAALQSAEGHMTPANNVVSSGHTMAPQTPPVFVKPDGQSVKWLIALAGVMFVIFLFAYLAKLSAPISSMDMPGMETATTTTGGANAESGVAQSADDALRGY